MSFEPSCWRPFSTHRRARIARLPSTLLFLIVSLLLLGTSGCAFGELFSRATPTPVPTRPPAPTFTPTPDFIDALVVVTPPSQGTPGVIVIPPGVDPRSVIPVPETPTPTVTQTTTSLPPTLTPTVTPTPELATATAIVVQLAPQTTATLSISIPGGVPVAGGGTPLPGLIPGLVPGLLTPGQPVTPTAPLPLFTPTVTPTPAVIATPTTTPSPTVTPTPFVLVATGLVNLRAGPGVDYPLVAQLGPNIPVAIVGQNPEGTWYQICCVNGGSVWVAENHIQVVNDATEVLLVLADAAPTATPTGTPTETPTITPTPTATAYPFQVIQGPLYFPTNNELLTIWVKIVDPSGAPLPGYFVEVLFRNRADGSSFEDRPNTRGEAPSTGTLEFNVQPGPASGNRVDFNYKFEFLPPDPKADDPNSTLTRASVIDGYWRIYLTDGSGRQLSEAIEFNTLAGNTNREVYVAWGLR